MVLVWQHGTGIGMMIGMMRYKDEIVLWSVGIVR